MRLLKILTILILSLLVIIFTAVYFFQKNISDNLEEKNENVTASWNRFSSNLLTRDSLITSLTSTNIDSLKYFVEKSRLERNKKENDLDLIFYEYKINEHIMAFLTDQKQIKELNSKLNNDLSQYNSVTLDYNEYFSIFPNFMIAKRHHYVRAKYFTIKYGQTNVDPIEKSKEMPEWAKGVDTN